jgi:Cu/Zn superoxide dismutase
MLRGAALAGGLVLAACSSTPEPRGAIAVAPRPELTSPPGEMSTQRLVLMKLTAGEAANKNVGTIALSTEGVGVLVRLDLKGLAPGNYVLSLNEQADCRYTEVDGKKFPAGGAGAPWGPEDTSLRLPKLTVSDEGTAKAEYIVPGLKIGDTRDRAFVVNSGSDRIACGISV